VSAETPRIDRAAIDAVVFDIGGVFLVREQKAVRTAMSRAGYDLVADPEAYLRAHHLGIRAVSDLLAGPVPPLEDQRETWLAWERGYLSGLGIPADQLDAAAEALLTEIRTDGTPTAWTHLLVDNVEGFRRIAAAGIPVAVVSNNDGTAEEQLRQFGVCQVGPGPLPSVRIVVDSHLVGVAKPDPAIFTPALEELGTDPARTLLRRRHRPRRRPGRHGRRPARRPAGPLRPPRRLRPPPAPGRRRPRGPASRESPGRCSFYCRGVRRPHDAEAGTATAPRVTAAGPRWLPLVAVLLLAVNLRPAVNALGAVVPELRDDTGLSASVTGVLLSLPMIAFAIVGLTAPGLATRFGAHRTVVAALAALTVGQVVRVAVQGEAALFAGSLLGLAGIALANVVLPGLVRLHFPDRIPLMTAAYTTLLTVGAAASAALANPLEHALDADWRTGIGAWALVSAVALVPWVAMSVHGGRVRSEDRSDRLPLRALARSPVAWTLSAYFGVQATLAYITFGWLPAILTDAGMSRSSAAYQSAIIIIVGVPPAMIVSPLLARMRRPWLLVVGLAACYVAGFAGLGVALHPSVVIVYSVLIGIGTAAFPVALTLIPMRSRTALATTSLSAFVQCAGYTIAALGPFAFGVLYEVTGSWSGPLLVLAALAVVQAVAGTLAVRHRYVEDDLPA
jgi:MFS transporter, CP family, cyanate transporter